MNKVLKSILLGFFVLLVLFLGIFTWYYKNHITPIPADTIGNTAGNLRGDGLFCEYNGKVYFSNLYDGGALYVMNPDCSEMERLISSNASYINAGGNYLFYYMQSTKGGTGLGYIRATTGVYRATLKGGNITCLNNDMATMMVLAGEDIYYQHYDNQNFRTFNKIPSGGSEEEITFNKNEVETACIADNRLYYAGNDTDHYLHAWDLETDTDQVIWQGNLCYPTVVGQYVYYMDIGNDYRLCRYDMANDQILVLTNDRLDFYNLYDNVIFYQKNDGENSALMRMNTDGSNQEIITEGIYNRINVTSAYTYFCPYGEDNVIYRTPTFGPASVDSFPQAQEAALEYQED